MATVTAHPPRAAQRGLFDPAEEAPRRPRAAPSRPTLDDLVAGAWDALQVSHAASCLVCGADVRPRWSSGPHPVGAACGGCGSELS